MRGEIKTGMALLLGFLGLYFLPIEAARFRGAIIEALILAQWYAREHVLLCLVPAFFIAGAIGVFVSQQAVMKYFGAQAKKWLAYSVASVSGTVLAVCSCTVLPLFGGIYMRGAGLGPAVAFLYSGPAINVLAIVLTARVLGWQLGLGRAIGAVVFSIVIGLLMHLIFRKEEQTKAALAQTLYTETDENDRPLWQTVLYFSSMVGILVFANWSRPEQTSGFWYVIFQLRWLLVSGFGLLLSFCLWRFFLVKPWLIAACFLPVPAMALMFPAHPGAAFTVGAISLVVLTSLATPQMREWRDQTWGFTKQILPLLLVGILAAGFFLGSPGSVDAGIIPSKWIEALVGDSPLPLLTLFGATTESAPHWLGWVWPLWTNFFASLTGALMYFATLTEVPILRGLLDSGMGQGPALALLLAGPALSLPNMLVINSVLGPKKTLTFSALVVVMATLSGLIFGALQS